MKCQIMFNRLQLNVKEMQIVANWSTHKTDWKNYTKLNLTKARNTGSSGQAASFPILKGLKAEIFFPCTFGKEKGYYLSSTLHSFKTKCCQLLSHAGAEAGPGYMSLWGYYSGNAGGAVRVN